MYSICITDIIINVKSIKPENHDKKIFNKSK